MIRIQTGRRLHFGLFSPVPVPELDLVFGGLGMMVDAPGIIVSGQQANEWTVTGQHQDRVESILTQLINVYPALSPLQIQVESMAPAHQGWGTGTQLALAIAKLCLTISNLPWSAADIATVIGRGQRSGIGVVGFDEGGLIFDSGKSITPVTSNDLLSVEAKLFPKDWTIVLVEPGSEKGLHSEEEKRAFCQLPEVDQMVVNQLRELAYEVLAHAAEHEEFNIFARDLTDYNRLAGSFYRSVQHSDYSTPQTEERLTIMEQAGALGRGQSSWGPGLFALFPNSSEAEAFTQRCHLPGCRMILTRVMNRGAITTAHDGS